MQQIDFKRFIVPGGSTIRTAKEGDLPFHSSCAALVETNFPAQFPASDVELEGGFYPMTRRACMGDLYDELHKVRRDYGVDFMPGDEISRLEFAKQIGLGEVSEHDLVLTRGNFVLNWNAEDRHFRADVGANINNWPKYYRVFVVRFV